MSVDVSVAYQAPARAREMADAAKRLLDSLSEAQRAAAHLKFFSDQRYVWNYRPVEMAPRGGLRLINMTDEQKSAAFALLRTGLSARGARQVTEIMDLEAILREHERIERLVTAFVRDPEIYLFSVFGEPGAAEPWGWRVGGHHIGVHFTIIGDLISPTPLFFGTNPAEVRHGPQVGHRILADEEDVARMLLGSLDSERKSIAIVNQVAPRDIITDVYRQVYPNIAPRGLAFGAMAGEQRDLLAKLIRVYVDRISDDLADDQWTKIERAGLDAITFAWAGPEERGKGHYYAITGPTFLIEYDNTQNDANHIHSVWRDFDGDWGEDLLAAHYAEAHRH